MINIKQQTDAQNTNTRTRIRFIAAYFLLSLLWMGGLGIISAVLLPQHLRVVVGATEATAIFGTLNATTAITSLLSSLIVGNLSDRTRSRWGQRTPWIIAGGIIGGISLFLIGIFQNVWLMGLAYCFSMIGLNIMIAPAMATLSDRVPENMRYSIIILFSWNNCWDINRDTNWGKILRYSNSRVYLSWCLNGRLWLSYRYGLAP